MSKEIPMSGKFNLLIIVFTLLLLAIGSIFWACHKDQSALQSRPAGRDTTSHDFEWKIYTFDSPYSSGDLYDVAIINENDIWAVGEIYSDSTHDWLPYNAVHWDGNKWELKKIPFYDETGYAWYLPLHSILAFSENDIWFEAGIHWNGRNYVSKKINVNFPSQINKMWGMSTYNFYIIGYHGLIAHFDGRDWQRIESGTEIHFRDIWGSVNEQTGEWEILALASYMYGGRGLDLIKINGLEVEHLDTTGLHISEAAVWFESGKCYYVGGEGLFKKDNLKDTQWEKITDLPPYYIYAIRGNKNNDVFVAGAYCFFAHYDGNTWMTYNENDFPYLFGALNALSVKGDLVVAVGLLGITGDKVIIIKGIRK